MLHKSNAWLSVCKHVGCILLCEFDQFASDGIPKSALFFQLVQYVSNYVPYSYNIIPMQAMKGKKHNNTLAIYKISLAIQRLLSYMLFLYL